MVKNLTIILVGCLLTTVQAQEPEVKREVGPDGVPQITIRQDTRPSSYREPTYQPRPRSRKAFRVYELDGRQAPPATPETKVVVVSSPPPIAPSSAVNNWGWGYGPAFANPGFYGPGFITGAPGFVPVYSNGFYRGTGFSNFSTLGPRYRGGAFRRSFRCR